MTLTFRVSAFFLSTLALVLVAFSLGIFLLARIHLLNQVDARLDSALATLSAAAETTEEGVEWEPHERVLILDEHSQGGPLNWAVVADSSQVIDASSPVDAARLRELASADGSQNWKIKTRRLSAIPSTTLASQVATKSASAEDIKLHRHLDILVGVQLAPVFAQLRQVMLIVSTLSLVSFGLVFVIGRQLCRRALAPVSQMADAARGMKTSQIQQRLPVSASRDELSDLALAFNALLDRVQVSMERQGRFTAEASHQLRTPLTAMLGQMEVALRRPRDPAEYVRVLQLALSQAHELRQLIDALLFLSRADEEARLPELQAIALGAWLEQRLAAWRETPRGNDVQLEVAPDLPIVRAHPVLLGQLLDNLVDNAGKYSPSGSAITVLAKMTGSGAEISVADEGCGLSPADRSHLFQPFYRGDTARAQGIRGTGLGLAIAARLAAALGGTLQLDETRARGTRLVLLLPRG